jgi:hypothetical protein
VLKRAAIAAAGFVGIAIYATWPLSQYLASRAPENLNDPVQNAWIFGWVAHAMVHNPFQVFHANLFHPVGLGLAFAENMIGLAIPVAPVFWVTGNAILTVNVAILLYLALGGVATMLLLIELDAGWPLSVAGGALITLVPYRVANIGHVHVIGVYLLPVVMLLMLRIERRPHAASTRLRLPALLAAVIALQIWSSLTGAVLLAAVIGLWLVGLVLRRRGDAVVPAMRIVAATVVAGVASLPVLVPYAIVKARYPSERQPLSEVLKYSATPRSYLAPNPTRGLLGRHIEPHLAARGFAPNSELHLFPGVPLSVAALAAGAAVVLAVARRDRRWHQARFGIATGIALGLLGFVLTLGPRWDRRPHGLPLLFALMAKVSGTATRVPARFAVLVFLGVTIAAMTGLAVLSPRARRLVAAGLIVLAVIEARPAHVATFAPPPITAAHRAVARRGGAVLALPTAELLPDGRNISADVLFEAQQLYLSTAHFRPMINGYASSFPTEYRHALAELRTFPSQQSFAFLAQRDVRTVVVETTLVRGTPWEPAAAALARWPGVRQVASGTGVIVYDVTGATRAASRFSAPA